MLLPFSLSLGLMYDFCYSSFLTAVADAIRTSLGPKGMDKMVKNLNNSLLVENLCSHSQSDERWCCFRADICGRTLA